MVDFLLTHHQAMLDASGVSAEVAAQRGYRSVSVKAELRRLGFSTGQSLTPALLIPIWKASGEVTLYHHRPDEPRIRDGKPAKYEFPAGAKMAIDIHPAIRSLVRRPDIPLFITEGIKKADSGISAGLCVIGVVGTWNWRGTNEWGGKTALPDWDEIALKAQDNTPRQVYIVYDSDVMLKEQVHLALARLSAFLRSRGAEVAFIYLPHGTNGVKTGLDDYLAAGHGVDDLLALASSELRQPNREADAGEDMGKEGDDLCVSQRLLVLAASDELFHDNRGDNYARFEIGGHKETWPIRSQAFKQRLSRTYYTTYDKPAGSQAMEDALRVLEGKARFDGTERSLAVRCAGDSTDGLVWLDISDPNWRAIRITANSIDIIDEPPPHFRRHVSQAVFAEPDFEATSRDIERLRPFVNVRTENAWKLLVAWLVAAWVPEIAHPVLVVHGEQGTAKSTLMRLLTGLIDPSHTPLRSEPRDIDRWVQMADHAWLITLDNVSSLPKWLSDAICRAVTGESFVKRQLYTDAEDVIMAFRRVVALTCIEVVAERGDLLDRAILLGLEPIPAGRRRPESEVLAEFARVRPTLAGALLRIVQGVLGALPMVTQMTQVTQDYRVCLPRMADFANIGIAVERVLGWPEGSFMSAYTEGIGEQNEEAMSGYLITEPLLGLVEGEWNGTAQELLAAITERVDEKLTRRTEWPKTAKSLSGQLRRLAPNLRAAGINVEFKRNGRKRTLHLTRQTGNFCVTNVICVTTPESKASSEHEADGYEDAADELMAGEIGLVGDDGDANDATLPGLSSDLGDDWYLEAIRR